MCVQDVGSGAWKARKAGFRVGLQMWLQVGRLYLPLVMTLLVVFPSCNTTPES